MKLALPLILLAGPAWGDCGGYEQTFLHCRIKNSPNTLSVCFDDTVISYRFGPEQGEPELELNELVWATTGRRTSVELPHDCHATFTFVKLGTNQSAGNHPLQPGNKASRTEMDDPSSLPAGR